MGPNFVNLAMLYEILICTKNCILNSVIKFNLLTLQDFNIHTM